MGDLFLTCSSEKSRNFTVGYRLGKGEDLDHIIETLGSVAEGVDTAQSCAFCPYFDCSNCDVNLQKCVEHLR